MKIDTQKRDIQASGLIGRTNFTVQAGAHIMAVLSGLYKNPVDAMVREYLTNMHDAVLALRRSDPTAEILPSVLGLPTSLAPELVFKDFGIGMSCETVMSVYSQYGNSTKNDSNLEVGGFGLGSKTAFCYNNGSTWTIESRHAGQRHVFMASIGETGVPFLAHVSSTDSTEHSGVTIRIPILRVDMSACTAAAKKYVPYFTQPLVVEGCNDSIPATAYIVQGDGWGIRPNSSQYYTPRQWHIIMGNVPYEVDHDDYDDEKSTVQDIDFLGNAFDFYVPIGSVDIVPSRDALKITDRTRRTIRTHFKRMKTELCAKITADVQAAPTYWDALGVYTNAVRIRGFDDVIPQVLWNGMHIDGSSGVSTTLGELQKIDARATVTQYGIVDSSRSTIETKPLITDTDTLKLYQKYTWLILEDMPKGLASVKSHIFNELVNHDKTSSTRRTRRYGHTLGHALVINTVATPAQLSVLFGGYPVANMMRISDMKPGYLPASQRPSVKDTIYRWNGRSWDTRAKIPTGKNYYLPLMRSTTTGRYVWMDGNGAVRNTSELMEFARQLGVTDMNTLYGVKASDVATLDTNHFTNLRDAVQGAAVTHATQHARLWTIEPTLGTPILYEKVWQLLIAEFGVPTIADPNFKILSNVLAERKSVRVQTIQYRVTRNTEFLTIETKDAIAKITSTQVIENIDKTVKQIIKKYPLLSMIVNLLEYNLSARHNMDEYKKVLLAFWNNPQ